MATADAKNRVYLFRLQMLIIDGGLLVLRNILDQKLNVQNISLSICLSQERPTITLLRAQKKITQSQYDLLYSPGGRLPSAADFDITLIICLLRNLKCFGFNRNFNWNVIPNPSDVSLEADIYRLRLYWKEVSHISTTTGIELIVFHIKWTEIEKILLRLNTSVINPVPNLQQTIDDIKQSPLDPEADEMIQTEVDEWRNLEMGVEVDLREVKIDAQAITEAVKQQHTSIQKVTGKMEGIYESTSEQQSAAAKMSAKNVISVRLGKSLKSAEALQQHEKRHNNSAPYIC